jgi:amidase
MRTVDSSSCIIFFDAGMKSVFRVEPGEVFSVQMRDALDGQVGSGDTDTNHVDHGRANPSTGPIAVEGAEPGQVLAIDILDIRVADYGYVTFGGKPRFFRQAGGLVQFSETINLPQRPMIGTIGVAPGAGSFSTKISGYHGGNMDVRDVCIGSTLYLPVEQPGGLLALGDVHSIQADGESSGQGVETAAEAVLRVRLVEDRLWDGPVIRHDGRLMVVSSQETLDDACQEAVETMAHVISARSALSYEEARVLIGFVGDVFIGQMVCDTRTARVSLPMDVVPWTAPLPL